MKNRLTTHQIMQVYKLHKDEGLSFIKIGDIMDIPWKTASSCWYVLHKNWSDLPHARKSYRKAISEIKHQYMQNGRNTKRVTYDGPQPVREKDLNRVGVMLDPSDPLDKALIEVKEALAEWKSVLEQRHQAMLKEIEKLQEYKKYEPIINALQAIASSRKE